MIMIIATTTTTTTTTIESCQCSSPAQGTRGNHEQPGRPASTEGTSVPLFAELTAGGQLMGLGVILMVASLLMRRSAARRRQAHKADPIRQVQSEFHRIEASHAGRITKLEVRLHDFAREVEGRIETRLALLDRLILDADEEITQLERLLVESRDSRRTAAARADSSSGPPASHLPAPHLPAPHSGGRIPENRVFPPGQHNSEAA